MTQFAIVTTYLYICFTAILFYKAAVLQAQNISFEPYGLAAIKALILGKFMLIGHAVGLGERYAHKPLIYPVLHKTVVFLVLLAAFTIVEEAIAGVIHGRTLTESISGIAGGTWLQVLATCLLMLLILLPYFAFRQIGEYLGEGSMRRMFFAEGR